jgi:hypothetical protein
MKLKSLLTTAVLFILFALPVSAQDTNTVYLPLVGGPVDMEVYLANVPTPEPPPPDAMVEWPAPVEAQAETEFPPDAVLTEIIDGAPGTVLHVAGRSMKLPDGMKVVSDRASVTCVVGAYPCYDEATVIVQHGDVSIEIGADSGKVLSELNREGKRQVSPVFNGLKEWLRELPPQSQRPNTAPTDQVGAASLSDPVFQAEASNLCQTTVAPHTENCAQYYWTTFNPSQNVYWRADEAIKWDYVIPAINVAKNLAPHLKWIEGGRGTSNQPDVEFKAGNCSGHSGYILSCLQYRAWVGLGTQDASYWRRAHVYINFFPPNQWFIPFPVKKAVVLREVLRIMGLTDRDLFGGCNPFDHALMDAFYIDGSQNLLTCDGVTTPTATDTGRVNIFWKTGAGTQPFLVAVNGDLKLEYSNSTWTPQRYDWWLYRYVNGQWVQQYGIGTKKDIGVHNTVENRTIQLFMNLPGHSMPHGYTYMVCGHPYLSGNASYGSWQCSNQRSW